MKRRLQKLSRARSSRLFRKNMANRRLRRWWMETVTRPLIFWRLNTRPNRRRRLMDLMTEDLLPQSRKVKPRPIRRKVWHRRRYTRAR